VRRSAQRELLDARVEEAARAQVAGLYERHRTCRAEHAALRAAAENRDARLDLLRYQLTELKAEVTTSADIEALFAEQKRIAGRGRLAQAASGALGLIYEDESASAHDLLAKASAALRTAVDIDPKLAAAAQLLGEAAILTREAADSLRHYLDALDMDPVRQEEIERKAAALEALARKHRQSVGELPAQLSRTEEEIRSLEGAEHSLEQCERTLALLEHEYREAAQRLTRARRRAAEALGTQITGLMQSLGMTGGRFAVSVEPAQEEFGPHGADIIEFLVSANPGQPLKSLAKVASGGELSRMSLAVQVAAAVDTDALCRVFDEVDTGIGGAVAEIVGRQLRALGEHSQVLCVTHLAQVAAQAHQHFRVTKLTDGRITRTAVKPLSREERVDEIARMSGGVNISEQARAHAREMLAAAGADQQKADQQKADQQKRKRAPALRR
jgi:DNA repair protein RecN (Recombination protein N)